MTLRERRLLLVVFAVGGLIAVFVGYSILSGILESFGQKDSQLAILEKEVQGQRNRLKELAAAQMKLEQWRAISLPGDTTVAANRYRPFLDELLSRHQIRKRMMSEGGNLTARTNRPGATTGINYLTYQVQADATLPRLIGFLQDFYSVNVPHSIRELSIAPQGTGPDARLDIQMRIEVLSMANSPNRDFLVAVPDSQLLAIDVFTGMKQGPVGLALGPWLLSPTGLHGARKLASHHNDQRKYSDLVIKNVFVGLAAPPEPESVAVQTQQRGDRSVLRYVQLAGITSDVLRTEAILRNRLTGKYIRLRAEGGFDSFTIHDAEDREVLRGKVKHIDRSDVVIQVDDRYYRIHAGEFLEQALRRELSPDQLKALGLIATVGPETP
ncbi:MAG: hypothetical protein NZM31_07795 [Gemmatales bacterium]|nr:hypothetical protein [Gemmatales bacterium]MDW8386898.1 hypothetical protein [Gemmatales bacterium]